MQALTGKGWPNPYQEAAQMLAEWLARQGGVGGGMGTVNPGPFGGAMPQPSGPQGGLDLSGLMGLFSSPSAQGQPFMGAGYRGGGTGLSDRLRDLYGPTGSGIDPSLLGPTPAYPTNFGGFNLGETPLVANMAGGWW